MFDDSLAGQPERAQEAAMTTGTVLAFIFIAITAPVAIVGVIWLEARMPVPQPQHAGLPPSPAPPPPGGPTG
jgi:hypothetical protein